MVKSKIFKCDFLHSVSWWFSGKENAICLNDVVGSRDNNLDLIRFVAALAVIIGHSYTICLGPDYSDFLSDFTGGGVGLGGLAVGVFFLFGGFLIAKSADGRRTPKAYFKARCLRIFPQLIFVVVLLSFVFGPLLSSLSFFEYFSNSQTYIYLTNAVFILQHNLPGVFEGNIYPQVVNGPLWTLPVEFVCYILCFIYLKATGFKKRSFAVASLACLGGCLVYFTFFNGVLWSAVRAVLLFYIGVAFYVYRDCIYINRVCGVASLALFVVLLFAHLSTVAMLFVFPYLAFYLGYATKRKFSNFGKHGEFSYGIYLWGWPIQQTLCQLGGGSMPQWLNAIMACVIALGFGILNYWIVDKNMKRFS
ncbi:MAG: acyltransferase [Solibacillus sp.]